MSHRFSPAATTVNGATTLTQRIVKPTALSVLFAVLLWAATAAGAMPIPGTPVPITLQTFVVMLAGLMLTPGQAAGAVTMYLAAGAAGLPVFAGGMSTAALVSPAGGFLLGFLPGVLVTALFKGPRRTDSTAHAMLTALRYGAASLIGCVVVVYAVGIAMQSVLTGAPVVAIATASAGFIVGDVVKATVASLAAAGIARLR